MKKALGYVLTAYVTAVTIACAVFGALYFLSRGGKDFVDILTFSEARELVHEVYETQVTKTNASAISANELQYSDFDGNELPEDMVFFTDRYVKTVRSFEEIFNNGWASDTWIKRKGSENDVGPEPGAYDSVESVDSIIKAAEYFKYSMDEQSVTLQVIQKTDSVWYNGGTNVEHPGLFTKGFLLTITRVGETEWKTDFYEKHYSSSPAAPNVIGDYRVTLFHVSYEAKEQKLVSCKTEEVLTTLKTYADQVKDEEIYVYGIFDCNLNTNKLLMAAGPNDVPMGTMPEYCQLLTKTDTVKYGKELYNSIISVLGKYEDSSTFKDFVEVSVGN